MKIIFQFLTLIFLLPVFTACGAEESQTGLQEIPAVSLPPPSIGRETLLRSLDELAEIERAGSWLQGMAVRESGIRENAGDYTGAVAAAYKELSLAYGRGLILKEDIERGLFNLLETKSDDSVVSAANAILAFEREQWADASAGLELLFDRRDEPDSFTSWMILVCALEKTKASSEAEDRRISAAYKSIRARYAQFPEYWYRGARAFSGSIAAEFAENCINSAVQGPFAEDSRKILAVHCGLKPEDGLLIKTKMEIEAIFAESINAENPRLLEPLFPLISLPENPYTVYATGVLRSLTAVQSFREYFTDQSSVSSGRLAERLAYICRG
ncbi:MAG: hypothetical protein FWC19_06120 [Treponema sp.]|nr:hypothetical protein [Treponema sp.]MCL2272361.1 hypothetical protein [Treponema sp.]